MTVSEPAFAEPSEADVAAAKDAFGRGRTAFDDGRFDDALTDFEASYAKVQSPNTLFMVGRSQAALGRHREAIATFDRTIREAEASGDPKYDAAKGAAADERDKSRAKLAKVVVVGIDNAAPGTTLTLDGEEIPRSAWGSPVLVDPGETVVAISGLPDQRVTIAAGAQAEVDVGALPDQAGGGDGGPGNDGGGEESGGGASDFDAMTYTYVAGGVAVAGLALWGIFGGLALSNHSTLEENCPAGRCPEDQRSTFDDGRAFLIVSNVGFAVGVVGVLATTGLVIYQVTADEGDDSVSVRVGPTGVHVGGSF